MTMMTGILDFNQPISYLLIYKIRVVSDAPMVLVYNGISEMGAHVCSEIGNLICRRNLFSSEGSRELEIYFQKA